ncbi:MAG: K+/H+ antiporter subunit F [Rubrivivax sp.]|nr:K+/H+ antiporter subunit F [Rubrivivax sp.]
MILSWALDFAFASVAVAMALCGWRLVRGPSVCDRVLALDTLYINTVVFTVLLGMRGGTELLFEAALLIAMLGFVSTVALARYVARGEVIE